jgi:hypothetical protein
MHTPNGRIATQFMPRERKPFSGSDRLDSMPDEYREEGTSYIAYLSFFAVDADNQSLPHSMFVSNFPNWLVNAQPRVIRMEEDRMLFSAAILPFRTPCGHVLHHVATCGAELSLSVRRRRCHFV